jgi:membrane protease YdiL (CAAX protease family)
MGPGTTDTDRATGGSPEVPFCSPAIPAPVSSRAGAGRRRRWFRFFLDHPWVEPVAFVALALGFEWIVDPVASRAVKGVYLTLVVLIPLASNVLHGDGPRALGFRVDNFLRSARMVGPASLAVLAVIVAVSYASGHGVALGPRLRQQLVYYPLWGLAQQWALQGFVHRRLCDTWHRRQPAAIASAVLFASLHYPNPVLVVFTLVGGYVWCLLYQRQQNLFTLALSHGWLGAIALVSLPAAWIHGLRVGPEF